MKPRLILADDHAIFRQGLKSLLEKENRTNLIAEASNGNELIEILNHHDCEIVLLDLSMPECDGIETLKKLKTFPNRPKILILTMNSDTHHYKHCTEHGAEGYMLKDEAFTELLDGIFKILNGENYTSPGIANILAKNITKCISGNGPSLEILTKRERSLLEYIVQEMTNKEIAQKFNISIRTVETHRNNMMKKIGVKNMAGLVRYAINRGIV